MRLERSPPPDKRKAIRGGNGSEAGPNSTEASSAAVSPASADAPSSPTPLSQLPNSMNNSGAKVDNTASIDSNDCEVVGILAQETKGKKSTPRISSKQEQDGETTYPNPGDQDGGTKDAQSAVPSSITDRNPCHNGSDKGDTPEIRRLDSDAYRPWGSRSNNPSPIPGSGSAADTDHDPKPKDPTICTGGPSKPLCNVKVMDGEGGVECEKCSGWFHSKCQGLSKGAMTTLKKWHGTLIWLCDGCASSLKSKPAQKDPEVGKHELIQINEKIKNLEKIIRLNAKSLGETIQNQEKMVAIQCKVLDKLEIKSEEEMNQHKSYADVLKSVTNEVVDQVSKKIEKMPQVTVPVQRNREEIAGMLDDFHDKERRKLNIIVHNLAETEGQTLAERRAGDEKKFMDMVKTGMKLVVKCSNSFRIGKRTENRPQLLLVTLANMEDKASILKTAASLRSSPVWSNVYVTPDLTWKEREKSRALRKELASRKEAGEEHIYIRHGRIVTIPEDKRRPSAPRSPATQLPDQDPTRNTTDNSAARLSCAQAAETTITKQPTSAASAGSGEPTPH